MPNLKTTLGDLVGDLDEWGAALSKHIGHNENEEPSSAVIVVKGQPETKEVNDAVQAVQDAWDEGRPAPDLQRAGRLEAAIDRLRGLDISALREAGIDLKGAEGLKVLNDEIGDGVLDACAAIEEAQGIADGEIDPNEEPIAVQTLWDILALVIEEPPEQEEIAGWTRKERRQAEAYAGSEHVHASDHEDVNVPPPPAVLRPYLPNV